MSVRDAASAAELAAIVQERLGALARAHELTMPKDPVADPNESVRLHALLHTILAPYHCSDYDRRLRIVGDDLDLTGRAVTAFALIFYELATKDRKSTRLNSSH